MRRNESTTISTYPTQDEMWRKRFDKIESMVRGERNPERSAKNLAEECLRSYLESCDSALQQSRGSAFGADGDSREQAVWRAKIAWLLLQRARLFVIGPEQYAKMHYAADRYTTINLAGLDFDAEYDPEVDGKDSNLLKVYKEVGPHLPFPNPIPFDACFLAYGQHLPLSDIMRYARIHNTDELQIEKAWLFGHVLGWVGDKAYAFTAIGLAGPRINGRQIGFVTTYNDGEWYQPMSLDPWVIPALIELINEHKKVVTEHPVTLGMKLDHKKQIKRNKVTVPAPKPYYTLVLRDELIDQSIKKTAVSKVVEWNHRWDVRGHESVRVMRGPLPIDPKLEQKLKKREYRVYVLAHMPGEDLERLAKRKVSPPMRDEWMAIKSYWVDPYVKGPENKPYIPAMRTMDSDSKSR